VIDYLFFISIHRLSLFGIFFKTLNAYCFLVVCQLSQKETYGAQQYDD